MTGQSVNISYNNISAEIGWPINNGELSSPLAGQQWVHFTEWCVSTYQEHYDISESPSQIQAQD